MHCSILTSDPLTAFPHQLKWHALGQSHTTMLQSKSYGWVWFACSCVGYVFVRCESHLSGRSEGASYHCGVAAADELTDFVEDALTVDGLI